MIKKVLKKIFGTQFEREVKKIQPVVGEINRIYEGGLERKRKLETF